MRAGISAEFPSSPAALDVVAGSLDELAAMVGSREIRNRKHNLSNLMNGALVLGLAFAVTFALAGSWLGWQLLRQNGRILIRLDELEQRLNELEPGSENEPECLPVGSEAPTFELPDLAGERKSLSQFHGQSVLLLFFNPECGFCRDLAPKLAAIRSQESEGAERPLMIVLSTGDAEKNRRFFAERNVTCPVLLQQDMEVAFAYKATGTPTGYLINADGRIASELAVGAEAFLGLVEGKVETRKQKAGIEQGLLFRRREDTVAGQAPALSTSLESIRGAGGERGADRAGRFSNRSLARSRLRRDGLKAGTPAPDFRLLRLDGRGEISLSNLKGKRVLLVFSDPHCGPCQELAPQLESLHRHQPDVEVVMISRGEPRENRRKVKEHGLTFPIVLQRQWEISRLYAMFATPIAYLVNDVGIITQDVAIGVEPILELMRNANASFRQKGRECATA